VSRGRVDNDGSWVRVRVDRGIHGQRLVNGRLLCIIRARTIPAMAPFTMTTLVTLAVTPVFTVTPVVFAAVFLMHGFEITDNLASQRLQIPLGHGGALCTQRSLQFIELMR